MLDRAKQSLGGRLLTANTLRRLITLVTDRLLAHEHFGLEMISILEVDKALSHLEEVAVRFVRREINFKNKVAISCNLLLCRPYTEWVFKFLACCFVDHGKKGPINPNWECEFVVDSQLLRLAEPIVVSETKIEELIRELNVFEI